MFEAPSNLAFYDSMNDNLHIIFTEIMTNMKVLCYYACKFVVPFSHFVFRITYYFNFIFYANAAL